jgi:hypothetical protein
VNFPDVLPPPALSAPELLMGLASGALAVPAPRLPAGAVPLPRSRDRREDPLRQLIPTFARLAGRAEVHACTPLDVASAGAAVRGAIVPDVAVAERVRAQITIPAGGRVQVSRRLDPVMAAPEIPTPMIGPLLEMGQDWLLPGIGDLPANTVAIVQPDAAFIEAYMVGLNHEMGRELLWRGFPTDQRGTVFSRFWDRRAAVSTRAARAPERDIPDIHEWDPQRPLGGNLNPGGRAFTVLLVRGDLLQRYPRPTIYLRRGRWERNQRGQILFDADVARRMPVELAAAADWTAHVRFPQFAGRAGADVMFLGFPLSATEVAGIPARKAPSTATDDQAGWYVVFEEQPTEPRFGPPPVPPAQPATVADALAVQLLRSAFRLQVHASDLIAT